MSSAKDRVLITGAGGMLGNAIYPYFSSRFQHVTATDKDTNESWISHLDVRDSAQLRLTFERLKPSLVLHLAACTDLEYCEVHPQVARDTNATATEAIARLCEEYGATLVYISTAGVFDGCKEGFYTEADQPRPIMVYGQTKYDGELTASANCSRHFIVRAGWMVGGGAAKDHKFVHHMLGQIVARTKSLYAVNDRFGTPTYTHDFALNLFRLLDTRRYGTYHMVCEGSGSRYDVARYIVEVCGRNDIEVHPVDSSYFGANYFAPRPVSEMMLNANLSAAGINLMRPWKEALRDYITREFPLAFANADPNADRRSRPERRRNDEPWTGFERRKSAGRRTGDLARRRRAA